MQREYFYTPDAKKEYFLNASDLRILLYRYGLDDSGGYRPRRYYYYADLEEVAIRKYGEQEFETKRRRRTEREQAKKREKDEFLRKAEAVIFDAGNSFPTGVAFNADNLTVLQRLLKELRRDIKRGLKPRATRINSYQIAATDITNVEWIEYAALIGHIDDPALANVDKREDWFTAEVPFKTVMGEDMEIVGTGGPNNRNKEYGFDPNGYLTVWYQPELDDSILVVEGEVLPVNEFFRRPMDMEYS